MRIPRRRFFRTIGAAPLAALAALRITITSLEVFQIPVNRRGNWLLVRLSTSAGITGIGDASHGRRDEDAIALLKLFFGFLKGRSIYDVETLRKHAEPEVLQRGITGAVALSGLEQALWDIRGKAQGVPCCDLLGGRIQSRIRNYANINRSTEERSPEGFAAMGEKAVAAGFDAIKLAPWDDMPRVAGTDAATLDKFTQLGIDRAAAVRKAIGPKSDLLLDAHSHFDLQRGLDLARRVEPLNLFWLEEVTPAQPVGNLAAINRAAKMPTAGGESIYGVKGFYPYIKGEAVDIVMPDVKYCGGMLEMKKIAALAEAAGLQVSPHGPASPVGNMAAAHVSATLSNFLILEFAFGEVPWRSDLVEPAEEIRQGYLTVPDRPGLGYALNQKMVAKHSVLKV